MTSILTGATLALLALSAVPAHATGQSTRVLREPMKAITSDPGRFLGKHLETEGYVLERNGYSAEMGGTDNGMIASDSLMVEGPQIRSANFYDRYRIEGVLTKAEQPHANGSPYALRLSTEPVIVGRQ